MISTALNFAKINDAYNIRQLSWLTNQMPQGLQRKNKTSQAVQAIAFHAFMLLPNELRLHIAKCIILPRDQINLLITCKALYALKIDVKVKLYEKRFALAIKSTNNKAIFKIIDECPDYKTKLFEFDSKSEGKLIVSLIDWASINGNVEMVRVLLADPEIDPSANDNSAILWAVKKGYPEIVKILTENEKIVLSLNCDSLINQARSMNKLDLVIYLILAHARQIDWRSYSRMKEFYYTLLVEGDLDPQEYATKIRQLKKII